MDILLSGMKIVGVVSLVFYVAPVIIYFFTWLLDNLLEKVAKKGGK